MADESLGRRHGRSMIPAEVGEAEWEYLEARREQVGADPHQPVLGLCLSGGGIRSATFNLGVLQGLSASPVLKNVDYLSTVSGGGFIGACFTTLVRHVEIHDSDQLDGEATPAPNAELGNLEGEHMPLNRFAALGHLRRHAQYLVTRRSPFSAEMLRLVGTILSGLIFTLLLGAMLLLIVVSVYLFAVNVIAGDAFLRELFAPKENFPGWAHLPRSMLFSPDVSHKVDPDMFGFLGVGCLCGGVGVLATYLRSWPPRYASLDKELAHATGGRTSEQRTQYRHVMGYGVAIVAMTFAAFGALHLLSGDATSLHAEMGDSRPHRHDSWLLGPLLLSVGAGVAVSLMHPLLSRTRRWGRSMRTVYYGLHGVNLALAVLSLAFAGCTTLLWWVHERETTLLAVMAASLFVIWAGSRGRRSEASQLAPSARDRVIDALRVVSAAVFVVVGFAFVTDKIAESYGDASIMADGPFGWWTLTLVGLVGATIIGLAVDFNKVSLNNFYMDRLAESYLSTTRKIGGKLRLVRDDGDLLLHHLQSADPAKVDKADKAGPEDSAARVDGSRAGPPVAPLHLIVGAINLAGTNDLARQTDKSEPFVFSSLYCGSTPTGYIKTREYRGGATTVAEAISISGAAVTSAMGSYTTTALAFGLTLLNLRMGQWLLNPRYYGERTAYPSSDDLKPRGHGRTLWWRPSKAERFVFWARYLFAEMRSHTTAEAPLVSVSDGGHTGDNCGIVPLLMRRCKVIVCSDASYDPLHACADFATGIRQILVDENTAIDIDVLRLTPGEQGRVDLPYAIGRVHYGQPMASADPESKRAPGRQPGGANSWSQHVDEAQVGWIIYMKLALSGDEPAAVSSYRIANPAFPHDPTSHQFFADEQLEAYRVLGLMNTKRLLAEAGDQAHSVSALATWCEARWNEAKRRTQQQAHVERQLDASVQ